MRAKRTGGVVLADGPAAGRYSVTRAPFFLRAVVGSDGRLDLLDQLSDRPMPGERVYVYAIDPTEPHHDPDTWGRAHLVIICPPPGASGTYRHRADVDGETLRETDAWRAWARAQPAPVDLVDGVTLAPRSPAP